MGLSRYPNVLVASGFYFWLSGRVLLTIASSIPPTTTPPTTIPQDGCFHEGQFYPNGAVISEDKNKCYGVICEGNSVTHWDHKCFLEPPTCLGWEERVEGQCCPICHTTPTTVPPTTTTPTTTPRLPENACLYKGTIYNNYDRFSSTDNGCTEHECHYGAIRSKQAPCQPVENCNGTVTIPEGQCCGVCIPPGGGCYIGGRVYRIDEVTNNDPCNFCQCTRSGQEICSQPQCAATDCENPYRPEGQCCYTCGSSGIFASLLSTVMILTTLQAVV